MSSSKVVIVIFELLDSSIIESQILLLSKEMVKKGADIEIWCFNDLIKYYERSFKRLNKAEELAGVKVRLFKSVYWPLPFSEIMNAFLIYFLMKKYGKDFNIVHARADYAAAVLGVLLFWKRDKVLIWDCRGDSLAEVRELIETDSLVKKIGKKYLELSSFYREILCSFLCERAIFVSDSLAEKKKYFLKKRNISVIPCTVSSDVFFFSSEKRKEKRKDLGLKNSDIVLIYTGSMVKYQGFDKYVEVISEYIKINDNVVFLVVTRDMEKAQEYLKKIPDKFYKICSCDIDEMREYYSAADFAILLREKTKTNQVASPTKFGEYCICGLPVIMNDSVEQSWKIANDLDICIPVKNGRIIGDLKKRNSKEREEIGARASELFSRQNLAFKYLELYKSHDKK